MYRADGPEELKVIGETEFVQGIAAKSASGGYGDKRIAAGIVGSADLRLGDKVAPVLEAHIAASPQRFRGMGIALLEPIDQSFLTCQQTLRNILLDSNFRKVTLTFEPTVSLLRAGFITHL